MVFVRRTVIFFVNDVYSAIRVTASDNERATVDIEEHLMFYSHVHKLTAKITWKMQRNDDIYIVFDYDFVNSVYENGPITHSAFPITPETSWSTFYQVLTKRWVK